MLKRIDFPIFAILLLQLGCGQSRPLSEIPPNTWTLIQKEGHGARRFSSFRYASDIDAFLLWGFQAFEIWLRGGPETPWDENQEYDIVAFDPDTARWEDHLPFQKQQEWSETLPPMYPVWYYHGITPGGFRPELRVRDGVLRPDLNIVSDQVTYDSRRSRMVYFTGGRTFAYDVLNREWSDIGGTVSPPPVSFGSLCYDPFGDRIILAGGGHVAEPGPGNRTVGYTGTWAYDCETAEWSRLATVGEPTPRMCTRLVCDTKNQIMLLFGGDAQSRYLSDTWILDLRTNTWRNSGASAGPEARAGHFTVYDPITGWTIIGGGYNRENLTDMWAYEVKSDQWVRLKGEVPVGWYITADIIPGEGVIVMTTSTKSEEHTRSCDEVYVVRTTYAYRVLEEEAADKGVNPVPLEDIPVRSLELATSGTQPDPDREKAQAERLRSMPVNRWVEFSNPGRVAPIRTWGSCAFDTEKGRLIYWGGGHCGYGGNDYDFYDVARHTWISSPLEPEFAERAWNRGVNQLGVTFQGAPWARHGRKIYAYDPVSELVINMKTVVLTAGYEPETLADCPPLEPNPGEGEFLARGTYAPDSWYKKWVTWTFDPSAARWEILCPAPQGLDLTVQTPHGVVGIDHWWRSIDRTDRTDKVLFEGREMVESSPYLLEVSERRWKKLAAGGPWPQNLYEMTALVHDSKRDQLILHGGGPDRNELWRFPMRQGRWEKINPSISGPVGARPPACNREAVYLPKEDVLLTAGSPPGEDDPNFWVYQIAANRWQKVSIELPSEVTLADMMSQNRAWAYDPIHDLILMVLGEQRGTMAQAVVYGLKYDHQRAEKK